MTTLLERDDAMQALSRALALARTGGQLVSVSGEAGIGKSSLLQTWTAERAATVRSVWGYCEPLKTPRPLGPLYDIAPRLGGHTEAALSGGASRHDVFSAFLADLSGTSPPVVCVEDVHWADDATMDLLQFVTRRLHMTRAVIVMSWRADEVGADHPIRKVLSATLPISVHRIVLAPLSLDAVAQLSGRPHAAAAVYALTRGNPFFVTELLAAPDGDVPASVRDAVLARRTLLESSARAVLDLVAVVPSRVELALLRQAAGDEFPGLEGCISGGLLVVDGDTVAFRHELVRLAVAGALSVPRVQACHRRILDVLLEGADHASSLARIVHHAEAASAADRVLEFAPAAARQAASVGAHRQALDHYHRALKHAALLPAPTRLELIEATSYEHYLTGNIAAAQTYRREALDLAVVSGDRTAVGRNTRWLSRLAWFAGDGPEALRRADEAIAALSDGTPGTELAMAFSNRSQIAMLRDDYESCLAWGGKAIELARALNATDILSHALNNVGTTRLLAGEDAGRTQVEESLAIALRGDLHEHAARAYTNLGSSSVEVKAYEAARRALDEGLAYCTERDLDSWTHYMESSRARLCAELALWQAALDGTEKVLAAEGSPTVSRIVSLLAVGLVRTRRGDPAAGSVLDDALARARATGEPQRLIPILLVRAEHAFWSGRRPQTIAAAREALSVLTLTRRTYERERAWYWLWKAGGLDLAEVHGDGPDVQIIHGNWRVAADEWERIGCPYERAQALAEGPIDAVRQALDIFHSLGAAPASDWTRQRLRDLGLASVPRGRRNSTLAHPAGLTVRETEVLSLLAAGLSNPQIGERLFVSHKTVEHHVSSILGKLNVSSRDAAVMHARLEGWIRNRPVDRFEK